MLQIQMVHAKSKRSKVHAQGAKDPWLLATSLATHQVIKTGRGYLSPIMQIEEGFQRHEKHELAT